MICFMTTKHSWLPRIIDLQYMSSFIAAETVVFKLTEALQLEISLPMD